MALTRKELEDKLEMLVESDGVDSSEISAVISLLDSMPDEAAEKEESVELKASDMGIEPTVVSPAEAQQSDVAKESNMVLNITKEQLGIGGEFSSVLKALDVKTIKSYLIDVQDTEDLLALVMPGYSQIDGDHRIHIEQRGEVRRAARGFGLFAAGGVDNDGVVTSPDGSIHFIEDGVCYEKSLTTQPDSFSGGVATIECITACLGHLDYRNVGSFEEPKWEKTGREYTRCLHQWALMFNAGFFVTLSKSTYREVVLTEIAQRVGDDKAREIAKEQIDEWRNNRQTRFETRKAYAMAIGHAKNVMSLPDSARLPDVPEVLEYKLPDGRTMREAILDLKGAAFVVEFAVPVNGEKSVQRVRAKNLNEIRSRMAPAFALAKTQGGAIELASVKVAA